MICINNIKFSPLLSRRMLPSTSVTSPVQGNGVLSSRDAARHTAGAKRYKYLRRLFRFRQMDFEFAAWQMLYLFTSPQRVYRNFHYRKQTKDQWARDDPAFLVLLSIWLCGKCLSAGELRNQLTVSGWTCHLEIPVVSVLWVIIWGSLKLLSSFLKSPKSPPRKESGILPDFKGPKQMPEETGSSEL